MTYRQPGCFESFGLIAWPLGYAVIAGDARREPFGRILGLAGVIAHDYARFTEESFG